MNKLLKYVSLLLIFTLAIGINTADAQKRKTKRQLREEAEAAAKKEKAEETKNIDDDTDATEDYFDDKKGHILLKNQPLAICDKTAAVLQALNRDDIYFSESTFHYDGGGCC